MNIRTFAFGLLCVAACSSAFATPGSRTARHARQHDRQGRVTIIIDDGPSAEELAILREQLEIERQQLLRQKTSDRSAWEIQMKDRDQRLQDAALDSDDGMCADHFIGTRCRTRASSDGFCARHLREIVKGIKDRKYREAAQAAYP